MSKVPGGRLLSVSDRRWGSFILGTTIRSIAVESSATIRSGRSKAQPFGRDGLLAGPTFLDFELRLPPTKDEETAIVEVLSDLKSAVEALEARLTKARALKQAMTQALLTGRRLVP